MFFFGLLSLHSTICHSQTLKALIVVVLKEQLPSALCSFMSKSTLVFHFDLFAQKHRREDATVKFLSANFKRMVDLLLLEKSLHVFWVKLL